MLKLTTKTCLLFSILPLFCAPFLQAAGFKSEPLVDGLSNPAQVVVTNHNPVFSWEYTGVISSFTITVSLDNIFGSSGEVWNFAGSTSIANTINDITRIEYNTGGQASQLTPDRPYYWQVTLFENGAVVSAPAPAGQFSTVASAVTMAADKLNLAVDWNNPFNPEKNQYTKFRFTAKDRDRRVQLRVYTLSGELVKTWAEQTILQNAWYSIDWYGKNDDEEIVARGIYLVNLMDVGEGKGITKKVAIVK